MASLFLPVLFISNRKRWTVHNTKIKKPCSSPDKEDIYSDEQGSEVSPRFKTLTVLYLLSLAWKVLWKRVLIGPGLELPIQKCREASRSRTSASSCRMSGPETR